MSHHANKCAIRQSRPKSKYPPEPDINMANLTFTWVKVINFQNPEL